MVHIITQYYEVKYKNCEDKNLLRERQDEITLCFQKNLEHPDVEKIHFLYELKSDVDFLEKEGIDLKHSKIVLYNLGSRMKYNLIFEYANQYLPNQICVYLHSDMYIKSGFHLLNLKQIQGKVYALTSHSPECNGNFICHCTRQYYTPQGWYGVTFDGFVFSTPLKNEMISETNHHIQRLGGENRLICILKDYGYQVVCPNQILKCIHLHKTKIFETLTKKEWITRNGKNIDSEYFSKIHKLQKIYKIPYQNRIVAGGIPFFQGSCSFTQKL